MSRKGCAQIGTGPQAMFSVDVVDTTAPSTQCPADVQATTPEDACGVGSNDANPAQADHDGDGLGALCDPADASLLAQGGGGGSGDSGGGPLGVLPMLIGLLTMAGITRRRGAAQVTR